MSIDNSHVWFTWETQRRNQELADRFNAKYCRFDYSAFFRPFRYIRSSWLTLNELRSGRPRVVFAQCPSVVLVALLALLKPIFRYVFIIDAHNAAFDESLGVRQLSHFAIKRADAVIVSNDGLNSAVKSKGGLPLELPDRLPHLSPIVEMPEKLQSQGLLRLVLVASFADDEPISEFLEAANSFTDRIVVFVTGRRAKAGTALKFESESIRFTDFLSSEHFDSLIQTADLVVDLTTRDNCLVCGGYEAIAAGVPAMLSDNQASRETFSSGCLFVKNDVSSYRLGIEEFLESRARLQEQAVSFRSEFTIRWEKQAKLIEAHVDSSVNKRP